MLVRRRGANRNEYTVAIRHKLACRHGVLRRYSPSDLGVTPLPIGLRGCIPPRLAARLWRGRTHSAVRYIHVSAGNIQYDVKVSTRPEGLHNREEAVSSSTSPTRY